MTDRDPYGYKARSRRTDWYAIVFWAFAALAAVGLGFLVDWVAGLVAG